MSRPSRHVSTPAFTFSPPVSISLFAIGILLYVAAVTVPPFKDLIPTVASETKAPPLPMELLNGPITLDPGLVKTDLVESSSPIRIIIPSQQIDVRIVESPLINGVWALSSKSASHGQGTALPGQPGNIVIYAHARAGLFQNLPQTKIGEPIYLFTASAWYKYKVTSRKYVSPQMVEIVRPTTAETLTLFTCSGVFDSQRFILRAQPDP